MTFKTIFIIIVSVLVTVVLMNNTEEISFWFFGEIRVPKLIVLGVIFLLGLVVGFILGRPRKKTAIATNNYEEELEEAYTNTNAAVERKLSEEDQEYLR